MPDLYLGIDTSNYKTSVAVTDADNRIVFARSEYLEVAGGSRGLRQSEAFFRHSNRLPSYIDEVCRNTDISDICAAGVSSRPRRVEGSYMPCFLAGVNAAKEISSVLGIPLHEFSHQEGHAAAIIENDASAHTDRCALFHLSGGTTETLVCTPDSEGYTMEIAGGTKDISIGQLIDRAGVAMGFPFPSGMYLDRLASEYYSAKGRIKHDLPPVRIDNGFFNLSGIETKVLRQIGSCGAEEYPRIAYSIFELAASLLRDCAAGIVSSRDTGTVYMAGGVSASTYIRGSVTEKLRGDTGFTAQLVFGDPELSGDNAVGTARLARRVSQNSI